jgi:hypothetical protein
MLNAVRVRATGVLVDIHRGSIDPALPLIQGNHAIAAIETPIAYNDPSLPAAVTAHTGKRSLIFDPTDTYTPQAFSVLTFGAATASTKPTQSITTTRSLLPGNRSNDFYSGVS